MTNEKKLTLIKELADYNNSIGTADKLSVSVFESTGAIEVHTEHGISGTFIKMLSGLAVAYNWIFCIYTEFETNKPYILICK